MRIEVDVRALVLAGALTLAILLTSISGNFSDAMFAAGYGGTVALVVISSAFDRMTARRRQLKREWDESPAPDDAVMETNPYEEPRRGAWAWWLVLVAEAMIGPYLVATIAVEAL